MTLWKTQCAQSVQNWLDAHPWNVKASTEQGMKCCAGLGACLRAMWCIVLTFGSCARSAALAGVRGSNLGRSWSCSPACGLSALSECVSSESDGAIQGERYCNARGEILRSLQDPLQRRRSARMCSSIKDESLIEDSQRSLQAAKAERFRRSRMRAGAFRCFTPVQRGDSPLPCT